jgi:amidophosphoribosyltransferase
MCGIVGLLIKDPAQRDKLGEWLTPMLVQMGSRGPESAGLAVFGEPLADELRQYALFAGDWDYDFAALRSACMRHFDTAVELTATGNHALLRSDVAPAAMRAWLASEYPALHLLSVGRAIGIYKDAGAPADIARRYGFSALRGSHAVGHTRMATESAVTPDRAHPFTAGEDFCLVHNGTISNPFMVRRKLEHAGIRFQTDNDTEAACRFLEWRLREGDELEAALERGFDELDGFYTFLIGTQDKLAIVRDAFACKPAVAAETDTYVAVASEFRALAHLPAIGDARLFEPMPEEIHSWRV